MMITFLKCSTMGVLISAFYLFVVLPSDQDFVLLVIFFSFAFVPTGLLMPRSKMGVDIDARSVDGRNLSRYRQRL
jgi:hypothetical protein